MPDSNSLSKRALRTPPSPIRKLAHLARTAKAEGTGVHYLNIGQPDIPTPPEFFEGLRRFDQRVVAYGPSEGDASLRKAWTNYLNAQLSLRLTHDEIMITTGASEALVFTFMTLCDPGDEVVVFEPTYANYIGFAAIAGVKLVPTLSELDRQFAIPPSASIVEKITPRTRAILLCSPNNPTGTVYTREEIRELMDICNRHDLFFVVDETYRELVYDGLEPLSALHLDPDCQRLIVIDSLSKRFSLCGARIGCILTPNQDLRAKILNQAQARLSCAVIEQFAAAYMLENISDDYFASVRMELQARRDALHEALVQIPGLKSNKPKGAFYTVARLPVDNAERFTRFLLSEFSHNGKTVFLAPAAGFYMASGRGVNKVRIAYVLNREALIEAAEILRLGLAAYAKRRPRPEPREAAAAP